MKLNLLKIINVKHIHNNFIKNSIIFNEQSYSLLLIEFGSENYKVYNKINNLNSYN